jgi:hypothetical protein
MTEGGMKTPDCLFGKLPSAAGGRESFKLGLDILVCIGKYSNDNWVAHSSQGNLFLRKCTDYSHCRLHYTHKSAVRIHRQMMLVTCYKAANTHLFFPSLSIFRSL